MSQHTTQALSRALAAIAHLPQQDPVVKLKRASIAQALAQAKGDIDLLRSAIHDYEEAWRSCALPADVARFVPDMIEDCQMQLRLVERERGQAR